VRKSLSPQRVASVSNLCNSWSQRAGNMGNGECCSGFGKRVCPFISGKTNMTGDPLEASSYTGGEGVKKDPKYPRRILVGEMLGPRREG